MAVNLIRLFGMSFVALILLFSACSKESASPTTSGGENGGGNELPGLPGALFSVDTSTRNVFRLDLGNWGIDTLNTAATDISPPVVSVNAQKLVFASSDSTIRIRDLVANSSTTFNSPFKILGRLTTNVNTTLVAFSVRKDSTSKIAVLTLTDNSFSAEIGDANKSPREPLFGSQGDLLVWTQDDGLFSKSLNTGMERQISTEEVVAYAFSPNESYVATSGGVYNITNSMLIPQAPAGRAVFLPGNDILYTSNNTIRIRSFSGTSDEEIATLSTSESVFTSSPDGRYICWSDVKKLSFYDLQLNEVIADTTLPIESSSSQAALYWRQNAPN